MSNEYKTHQSQVSSTYSMMVGDLRVTVILDSLVEFPLALVTGALNTEVQEHQAKSLRGEFPTITINAYLVESDSAKVLIDTGVGGGVEPSKGRLTTELRRVGIEPAEITHVLFTHLHADHAGGGITPLGEAVFPDAAYFAHRDEKGYWFGGESPSGGEALLEQYDFTQTLLPILSKFTWVDTGNVLPGIELVHLPGHTPGHSGYRIESKGESLFIWGDIVHQPQLQFAHPEWGVAFDSDQVQASRTRKRVMQDVSERGELIAGLHIDFPGIGHVKAIGEGGYEFVPKVWEPAVIQ
ncbi:MBL fold metallo-hydrolase [Arthrobacter sp. KNU40]|uniref:MBL fold metallo-hydrolase n=1 Tax=Arthrobacter sp. KNU40 TaxID=3447965 RepID=UPI003F6458FC